MNPDVHPYLVSISLRVTPVPIPNTTVKPLRAHDTAGEALWESRSSPVTEAPSVMPGAFFAWKNNSLKFNYIIEEKMPEADGQQIV